MSETTSSYLGRRFPPLIISHAVWLYHRFCLSLRDVEDLLAERGITVSYETIRQWYRKFGPKYARKLRRRVGRHLLRSEHHRVLRERSLLVWRQETCAC